ncbi:sugar ABC transporter substrate-binding protein [Massilia sp. BJB1822]|nr:sugar ABC transporter substrate-binding protein [Massilia sp. BJB1822]
MRSHFFRGLQGLTFSTLIGALLCAPAAYGMETVRVTVAHYSNGTAPYFRQMAEQFERANPGIRIKVEDVNWDSLLQKLQIDVAGGVNADISIIGTRWLPEMLQDDLVEPLDGYMDPAFRERFIGAFLTPGQAQGKTYGLPIAASVRGLFYNKQMLAKAGFPDGPATWSDVQQAARRIKQNGGYGFGLQGKEIETDVYWYYALWTHGGELLDAQGKPAFASPAAIKSAKLYQSLIGEGLTQPGVTSYSREDVQNLFKQGRLGMMISAPFVVKQLQKEVPGLQWGIVPIPTAGRAATFATTDSLILFKNSRVKRSAWKFMDFLFTKAPRVAFTSAEGFMPTTKEEAADPAFADPLTRSFVDMLPTARFTPTVQAWEDIAKSVSNAMQAVYLNRATPEQALGTAAAEAEQALKKN